jgi:hypothetical protein
MSDKPAVMQGVYVDCKFMPGLKSARISIDLPIEHSNEFLRMFGAPDRANPVAVAIARLDVEALKAPTVPEKAAEPAPVEKAESERSKSRTQAAGRMVKEEAFQIWLAETFPEIWDRYYIDGDALSPEAANLTLKEALGVLSKKELDSNPAKGAAWDQIVTSYKYRNLVRA